MTSCSVNQLRRSASVTYAVAAGPEVGPGITAISAGSSVMRALSALPIVPARPRLGESVEKERSRVVVCRLGPTFRLLIRARERTFFRNTVFDGAGIHSARYPPRHFAADSDNEQSFGQLAKRPFRPTGLLAGAAADQECSIQRHEKQQHRIHPYLP